MIIFKILESIIEFVLLMAGVLVYTVSSHIVSIMWRTLEKEKFSSATLSVQVLITLMYIGIFLVFLLCVSHDNLGTVSLTGIYTIVYTLFSHLLVNIMRNQPNFEIGKAVPKMYLVAHATLVTVFTIFIAILNS